MVSQSDRMLALESGCIESFDDCAKPFEATTEANIDPITFDVSFPCVEY